MLLVVLFYPFMSCITIKENNIETCDNTQNHSVHNDAWFSVPESDTGYKTEPLSFFQILSEQEEYAISQLDTRSFIQIDEALAETLIGKKPETIDTLILVRGVAYNKNFTDFTILSDGENLFIVHMSLGHSDKIIKYPIIINVKSIPKTVYSACGQAN